MVCDLHNGELREVFTAKADRELISFAGRKVVYCGATTSAKIGLWAPWSRSIRTRPEFAGMKSFPSKNWRIEPLWPSQCEPHKSAQNARGNRSERIAPRIRFWRCSVTSCGPRSRRS